jgi:hypothetical protein
MALILRFALPTSAEELIREVEAAISGKSESFWVARGAARPTARDLQLLREAAVDADLDALIKDLLKECAAWRKSRFATGRSMSVLHELSVSNARRHVERAVNHYRSFLDEQAADEIRGTLRGWLRRFERGHRVSEPAPSNWLRSPGAKAAIRRASRQLCRAEWPARRAWKILAVVAVFLDVNMLPFMAGSPRKGAKHSGRPSPDRWGHYLRRILNPPRRRPSSML